MRLVLVRTALSQESILPAPAPAVVTIIIVTPVLPARHALAAEVDRLGYLPDLPQLLLAVFGSFLPRTQVQPRHRPVFIVEVIGGQAALS